MPATRRGSTATSATTSPTPPATTRSTTTRPSRRRRATSPGPWLASPRRCAGRARRRDRRAAEAPSEIAYAVRSPGGSGNLSDVALQQSAFRDPAREKFLAPKAPRRRWPDPPRQADGGDDGDPACACLGGSARPHVPPRQGARRAGRPRADLASMFRRLVRDVKSNLRAGNDGADTGSSRRRSSFGRSGPFRRQQLHRCSRDAHLQAVRARRIRGQTAAAGGLAPRLHPEPR